MQSLTRIYPCTREKQSAISDSSCRATTTTPWHGHFLQAGALLTEPLRFFQCHIALLASGKANTSPRSVGRTLGLSFASLPSLIMVSPWTKGAVCFSAGLGVRVLVFDVELTAVGPRTDLWQSFTHKRKTGSKETTRVFLLPSQALLVFWHLNVLAGLENESFVISWWTFPPEVSAPSNQANP